MKTRGAESAVSNETQNDSRAPKSGGPGTWFNQARTFTDEAMTELKRVYWPSAKETRAFTVVVLVVVAFVSLYLGVVDYMISLAMRTVFGT
jgi:preprotein translocase subunit SecE